jgi:large subunit ribosomal protein L15
MKLNTLTPSEGSTKNRVRELVVVPVQVEVEHLQEVIKELNPDQDISLKSVLKVVKCPFREEYLKFGFKSFNQVEFKPVNLDTLQNLAEQFNLATIDMEALVSHGIASKNDKIKILGGGELTAKLDVTAHKFSASAVEVIEKLGGTVNKI